MLVAGMGVQARRVPPAGATPSTIEMSRRVAAVDALDPAEPSARRSVAPRRGRPAAAAASSMKNQAIGTSSASAMDARQVSDGEALSFSIWDR